MANRWIIPNTLLHRVLILTWLAIGLVNAVTEPISIKGTKFFYPNGTQFFIKGVVYSSSLNPELDQYTGTQDAAVDVLADIHACSRDASYLSWLGVNTVSTLFLDWSRSHALCFEQFAEYDIWVIPLLQSGNTAINSTNPSWNTTIYDVYQQAVDEVSKYNNTLAIFAGYENVANVTNTGAYAAVKAAARDTKAYMRSKNYREIPVGYGFADITNEDHQLATIDYLTCGPPEETADFIGKSIGASLSCLHSLTGTSYRVLRVVWQFDLYAVWLEAVDRNLSAKHSSRLLIRVRLQAPWWKPYVQRSAYVVWATDGPCVVRGKLLCNMICRLLETANVAPRELHTNTSTTLLVMGLSQLMMVTWTQTLSTALCRADTPP